MYTLVGPQVGNVHPGRSSGGIYAPLLVLRWVYAPLLVLRWVMYTPYTLVGNVHPVHPGGYGTGHHGGYITGHHGWV